MPRTKENRNPLGSITQKKITKEGKKITVYIARKRFFDEEEGRWRDKTKRCRSYSEAQTQLTNFNNEVAEKAEEIAQKVEHTFFELIDYFADEYVKEAVFIGDRQLTGYRQETKPITGFLNLYKEFFGEVPISQITYERVRQFAEKTATTPLKKHKEDEETKLPAIATVNRKLAYLRRVLNVGVQLQWLIRNPFNLGKSLIDQNSENVRDRTLTYDEETRLLAACEGDDVYSYKRGDKIVNVVRKDQPRLHLKLIIIFAIETGMRRGEMFTTKWSQVDLASKVILLNAKQTKALKKRTIPISSRMEKEFLKILSSREISPEGLIFDGIKKLRRSFKTACKRAKIEDLRFHDLRHTASTWMNEAGVSQAARMNIVGHTSERIHLRYNNINEDILESARLKMDELRRKIEAEQESKVKAKVKVEKAASEKAA